MYGLLFFEIFIWYVLIHVCFDIFQKLGSSYIFCDLVIYLLQALQVSTAQAWVLL